MLARLILSLLLLAFALPALANGPCHDMPMAMTGSGAGLHAMPAGSAPAGPHGDAHLAPHVCLGCIPPASVAARALAAPLARDTLPRRITAVAFDPATGTAPALPPPRRKA